MSLTTSYYRFNVFKNGSYPNGGKAIMFNMSANQNHSSSLLQDLYRTIESTFFFPSTTTDCGIKKQQVCCRVFTEKGGEVTHVNQLFNDDILIFTTLEHETFLPLDFSIVSKQCDQQQQQQQQLFTVCTKWLSNKSESMENMVFIMNSLEPTVSALRSLVPLQVKKEALSNFDVAEFVVIYKGVELSDTQNLFTLYQELQRQRQQLQGSESSQDTRLTVYLVKKPFSIRVVTPSSRRITLTLECADAPETTIGHLKEMIYEQEQAMPCSKMKLYHADGQLISNDSTTLRDCGLLGTADRVLHLKYSVF